MVASISWAPGRSHVLAIRSMPRSRNPSACRFPTGSSSKPNISIRRVAWPASTNRAEQFCRGCRREETEMTKVERFYIGPQIATNTTKSEKTGGGVPIAAAARAGNMVWTNGVVSADPETGALVAGDIRVQTKRVLENLKMILEKAGTSFANVVMVHSFL